MPAVNTPAGWELVTDWPLSRAPMFRRIAVPGIMWIYRDKIDTWSLEVQGHRGVVAEGSLDHVVEVAHEWDTAHNVRVCGMSDEEFAGDMYGRSLIAVNALADSDVEVAREQIGKMEAVLHDLRGRLRDKESMETYASKAERKSAELKWAIHDFYTWALYGHNEGMAGALAAIDVLLEELRGEVVGTPEKSQAS